MSEQITEFPDDPQQPMSSCISYWVIGMDRRTRERRELRVLLPYDAIQKAFWMAGLDGGIEGSVWDKVTHRMVAETARIMGVR